MKKVGISIDLKLIMGIFYLQRRDLCFWRGKHRIIDHRAVWVGRDLKDSNSYPTAMGRNTLNEVMLLRAPFNLVLNTSRNEAPTTSPGNMYQCVTTLAVKNFFLTIHPNVPTLWKHYPLSYHYVPLWKVPLQVSCRPTLGTGRLRKVSLKPSASPQDCPQPILCPACAWGCLTHVQDLALGLVELYDVCMGLIHW